MPPRSHDHKVGSSSVAPATPPAIDPALATILQSLTQQHAHLAAEQAQQAAIQQQMSEFMLSMFQTIQNCQDTLQQQLLADRQSTGHS
jgi:erythromycin esterase-like protein